MSNVGMTESDVDTVLAVVLSEDLSREWTDEDRAADTMPCPPCLGLVGMPKVCACGASYDETAWVQLVYLGEMHDGDVLLELRNCSCGSTLAVEFET